METSLIPVVLPDECLLMEVTCPTCFEVFDVSGPHITKVPCSVDYDCEVCCRPMQIDFTEEDGEVVASARGLGE